MSNIDLAALAVGGHIARLPDGYFCKVTAIERPRRARVYDARLGKAYWIGWPALKAKWRVPGGK